MPVKPISSVDKALRVLEAVGDAQPVGVSALARSLGFDKNAVQRALVTLGQAGWLRRSPTDPGSWELTSRVLRLAQRVAPDLRDVARPHLESLQVATEETVLLWQRSGDQFVLLDAVESTHPLRLTVPIGTQVAIDTRAASLLPASDRPPGLEPEATDERESPGSTTFRRRGYFVIDRTYPNSVALAAPFVVRRTGVLGSIVVVGPRSRIGRSSHRRFGDLVAAAAAEVAASA